MDIERKIYKNLSIARKHALNSFMTKWTGMFKYSWYGIE